jgi:hypothetical protein
LKADYREAFYAYIGFFIAMFSLVGIIAFQALNESLQNKKMNAFLKYSQIII